MSTVYKIALKDPKTGLFFSKEKTRLSSEAVMTDLRCAKLFAEDAGQTMKRLDNYYHIFDIRFVPVRVRVELTEEDSDVFGTEYKKMQNQFQKLDNSADIDIDAMSEKDYRKWKSLKRQLSELDTLYSDMI
jgi:hypothetical protein